MEMEVRNILNKRKSGEWEQAGGGGMDLERDSGDVAMTSSITMTTEP